MPKIAYLERHAHAPELNALILRNGARFAAPGCVTIESARAHVFPRVAAGLAARVSFERDSHESLNRSYSGRVPNRAAALKFARDLAATRHAGGALADGSILPPARYRIAFDLIGA